MKKIVGVYGLTAIVIMCLRGIVAQLNPVVGVCESGTLETLINENVTIAFDNDVKLLVCYNLLAETNTSICVYDSTRLRYTSPPPTWHSGDMDRLKLAGSDLTINRVQTSDGGGYCCYVKTANTSITKSCNFHIDIVHTNELKVDKGTPGSLVAVPIVGSVLIVGSLALVAVLFPLYKRWIQSAANQSSQQPLLGQNVS